MNDDVTSTIDEAAERLVASSSTATAGAAPSLRVDGVTAAELEAKGVHAWVGDRLVLEDVNLVLERTRVTAWIGPAGGGARQCLGGIAVQQNSFEP